MSTKYATPLSIKPGSSRTYLFIILVIHSLACLAIALSTISFAIQFILFLFVTSSGYLMFRQAQQQIELIWNEEDEWELMKAGKQYRFQYLEGNTVVLPWLVILVFRSGILHYHHVFVFKNSIEAEIFRQLKVRLKITPQNANQ